MVLLFARTMANSYASNFYEFTNQDSYSFLKSIGNIFMYCQWKVKGDGLIIYALESVT